MPEGPAPRPDYVDGFVEEWRRASGALDLTRCALLLRTMRASHFLLRGLDDLLGDTGLTTSQFVVLATLLRRHPEPLTATEIRRAAILTSGSVTSLLDRLEKRGLVARGADPRDRRLVRVRLTRRGRTVIGPLVATRVEQLDAVQAHLAPEQVRGADEALRALLALLEPVPGDGSPKPPAAASPVEGAT